VWGLLIADIDNNNIDDLIRVVPTTKSGARGSPAMDVYEWQVSSDGTTTWRPLKTGPPNLPSPSKKS